MPNWLISRVPVISSTMDWVRCRIDEGAPDFTALLAECQTNGRGRLGRSWTSPTGNIYFSFLMRDGGQSGVLPLALAIALHDALRPMIPQDVSVALKWPNDILVMGHKIAGILIERHGNAVAVGVGVNIASAPDGAARLSTWFDGGVDDVLSAMTTAIDLQIASIDLGIIGRWNELSAYHNQEIMFKRGGNSVTGIFKGVDANGHARIADETGVITSYASGEIMEIRPCS